MTIATAQADRFSIPLPETLSDSTHGKMSFLNWSACEFATSAGPRASAIPITVGTAADTILSLIRDDLSSLLVGADASRIEGLWQRMWRHLHYAGRGGPGQLCPLSAIDIALWRLLGRHNPEVLAYAGEIDLFSPLTSCWPRPRPIWTRVFTP
jgi:L-alanine-DL-glutamate epimerase-like enolase superfamily enzyme